MDDVSASAGVASSASVSDRAYRKVYVHLIPFLMFCYLLAFLGRTNVGFAKLQFLSELSMSEAVFGFGAGIFFVGYVLFEVPSNLLLEKVGVRKTLLRIMVLWGLCATANALIHADWHFYTLRFLLGAAEAGFFPGVLFYLTLWAPARRRARLTGMFMSSLGITGIIGGPLSGWIMKSLAGTGGLSGWQWMFVVEGIPSIIFGVIAYLYLDDNPQDARWLSEEERGVILSDLRQEARADKGRTHHSFGAALKAPQFYILVGLGTALVAGTGGISYWLPTIISRSGVKDVFHVGLLSAIPFIVGVVAQQLIAFHSDRVQERRWHACTPAFLAGAGWIVLPLCAASPMPAMLALTVITAGTLGAMGPFWTMPSSFLSGPARAGGIALISTLAGVGSFFSPWLVGWLTSLTGSLAAGECYYGALMVVGAVILLVGIPAASRVPQQA